jgi:hypothetical protein
MHGPSPGRWSGLAGIAEGWRDLLSAWEELRIETGEFRELNGERVLVLNHFSTCQPCPRCPAAMRTFTEPFKKFTVISD